MAGVNQVVEARDLAPSVRMLRVSAPKVAARRRAGQFVIVRATADGERIPLTIVDADAEAGWITLVVQSVGKTTGLLSRLDVGDTVADLVGPLGVPTEVDRLGTVVVVGGGVGTAVARPIAVAMAEAGNRVVAVIGGRTEAHVLFEDDLRTTCDEVLVCTDDGSRGHHGVVTEVLADVVAREPVDLVVTAGPVPMMAAVAETTRPSAVRTIASLNPIMVDGTGMCGGCRVSVGGTTRFACVDGPEFDAHLVDFDILARRNSAYRDHEERRGHDLDPDCPVPAVPDHQGDDR